ncbi:Signal recognition particle receptor FtsY, partial [Haemophilus influenzae]
LMRCNQRLHAILIFLLRIRRVVFRIKIT